MIGLLLGVAWAASFGEGVERWQAGDAAGARAVWEEVAREGWGSGRLKYNLGNAYYRAGDRPRAIAWWRAAAQLRPRTGAINHNLALARSELRRVPPPAPVPAVWMQVFTPGELSLLGLLLAAAGSGMLAARVVRRGRGARLLPLASWAMGALLVAVATWGWWVQRAGPIGVVVDRPAEVRDAPSVDAGARFELPPGSEVAVVREAGPFLLVETGDGERGWVADGAIFRPPR